MPSLTILLDDSQADALRRHAAAAGYANTAMYGQALLIDALANLATREAASARGCGDIAALPADMPEMRQSVLRCYVEAICRTGLSPTIRDVCGATGLRSTCSVTKHLTRLIEDGYLVRSKSYAYRGIRLGPRLLAGAGHGCSGHRGPWANRAEVPWVVAESRSCGTRGDGP